MTAIVVKAFGGLKPLVSQYLLQPGDAQIAQNVRLVSGSLKPLAGVTTLKALTKIAPKTIFRYGNSSVETNFWLEFASDTDVINSPIPNDPHGRAYWSDGGAPKYAPSSVVLSGVSYPGSSFILGVPKPVSAPAIGGVAYSVAKATITAEQILTLSVGKRIRATVDGGSPVVITINGSGGLVTALTLALQLDAIAGLNATVVGTGVEVSTASSTATSRFKLEYETGSSSDYSDSVVSYTTFSGFPVNGVNAVGQTPATPATYTFSAGQITSIAPNSRYAFTINGNPAVSVTFSAAPGTSPASVTATSFKNALASVPGITAVVNDVAPQTVTITTTLTGSTASILMRLINPSTAVSYSNLLESSNAVVASESESRSYVITYVSAYGEEGPPSDPSPVVTVNPNQPLSVTNLSVPPGGSYNLTAKRLYRTSTVGSQAQFQFVAEIPAGTTSYADIKSQSDLGEVLPSQDWLPPPTGLRGLKMMANGVAVGFVGNTLHLSEPNLPHAWPHKYPVDYQIVGLSPFRQSVAILTDGYPFIASGPDPAGMTLERLEFPHACLSKQSIVDTGDGCLYAGADGVVSIGASGMKIVSDQLFTREQWQLLNPSSMRAFFHDSRYHVMYVDRNGVRGMLIFDFSGQGAALTTSNLNQSSEIHAAFSDPRTDTLYLAQGTSIVRFNASTEPLTMTWRTGTYRMVKPVNFNYATVRAQSYPVTFRTYNERNAVGFVKTVTNSNAFRLPAGFAASEWQFQVEGNKEVSLIAVSTSAAELQAIT